MYIVIEVVPHSEKVLSENNFCYDGFAKSNRMSEVVLPNEYIKTI